MPDYIDRDKLLEAVEERNRNSCTGQLTYQQLKSMIENFSAADVMEVTRCKDCKHYRVFLKRDMCAKNAQVLDGHEVGLTATNPDDFCSYGERKSG